MLAELSPLAGSAGHSCAYNAPDCQDAMQQQAVLTVLTLMPSYGTLGSFQAAVTDFIWPQLTACLWCKLWLHPRDLDSLCSQHLSACRQTFESQKTCQVSCSDNPAHQQEIVAMEEAAFSLVQSCASECVDLSTPVQKSVQDAPGKRSK